MQTKDWSSVRIHSTNCSTLNCDDLIPVSLFVSNEQCSSDEGQERLSHIQSENMTFSTTILTQRGKNLYV